MWIENWQLCLINVVEHIIIQTDKKSKTVLRNYIGQGAEKNKYPFIYMFHFDFLIVLMEGYYLEIKGPKILMKLKSPSNDH